MIVLVVGGCGFVGSHIVDALLAADHEVRVLSPHPELFRRPLAGVDYRFGRLEIGANMQSVLDGCGAVVDSVATAVPSSAADSPSTTLATSVGASAWLAETCLRVGVPTLVFLSSGGTVYGRGSHLVPAVESTPLAPIGTYGAAKAATELALAALLAESETRYVALRVANAYGERQNPTRPQGIVGVAMNRMRAGQSLTIYGDAVRDLVHVDDVAAAVAHTVDSGMRGAYNIGSGVGVAMSELLTRLEAATGQRIEREHKPIRQFDVPWSVVNTDRAREAGWAPSIALDDGLARTWNWFRSAT